MTIYSYVAGAEQLKHRMKQRGLACLNGRCLEASTVDVDGSWRGGASAYLRFAVEHPQLYMLMFSEPEAGGEADRQILSAAFEPLLDRVKGRLASSLSGAELEAEAARRATRYWTALHGLASLAISGRLRSLGREPEAVLDDLLERVAPTD
jgi:hypothetical protein